MIDKQINTCEFLNICQTNCSGTLEDTEMCHCYELYKQLKRKEQELQEAMDNYVQLDLQRVKEYNELVDLYNAKEQECEELKTDNATLFDKAMETRKENTNMQVQLDQLKAENERLKRNITEIFACLIKANRTNKIVDTIWVDDILTLWDYIALTLGIEGDQTQIEEQILQKSAR